MIHAYASIWRCLIHDITDCRDQGGKACVHVHHLEISTQEWKSKQLSAIIVQSNCWRTQNKLQHKSFLHFLSSKTCIRNILKVG